ncbi:FIVAR domain-containing protein, partial [Staphylococcus aureus]|uniref:FIVAR domain-containing protein n=1 Tax=Staphylococcus aureus TaxID=1280 RepID=UPI0021089800
MTKFIFVTGGVLSSLGKGITASSLGRLLKDRGLNVTIQKYLDAEPNKKSAYDQAVNAAKAILTKASGQNV